jgi:acetate kinase
MTAMREPILVVNAGSSSIKFSVFETSLDRSLVAGIHGQVEGIGTAPHLEITDPRGKKLADGPVAGAGHVGAIAAILEWFMAHVGNDAGFDGIGHRVVHGGMTYSEPVLIDDKVMAVLDSLTPLAPLHQPHHIATIRAITAVAPKVPQFACFDTAFPPQSAGARAAICAAARAHRKGNSSLRLPRPVLRVHRFSPA